jgi:hypothetical protein
MIKPVGTERTAVIQPTQRRPFAARILSRSESAPPSETPSQPPTAAERPTTVPTSPSETPCIRTKKEGPQKPTP